MAVRDALTSRSRRRLATVVGAMGLSIAAAAIACLPDVSFESPVADGGPEGSASDGAMVDGGADAPESSRMDASDGSPDGPITPAYGPVVDSICYGYAQTAACAVQQGTLYCWGDVGSNADGELGLLDESAGGDAGIVDPLPVTTTAQPASQIVQMVMGEFHSCALYGTNAYCWGANDEGQIGNGSYLDGGPTEVAVQGLPLGGLTAMAAALLSTCGVAPIQSSGNVSNVYCWGYNGSGELGRPVDSNSMNIALPVTGEIDGGPLGVIVNATQIAGGGFHFCALTSEHEIYCWGTTGYYESGPILGTSDCPGYFSTSCTPQPQRVTLPASETAVGIALGEIHSCALTQAGNVYCWGSNDSNQLGSTSVTQTCADGDGNQRPCSAAPVQVPVTGIQHLYAGGWSTCVLDSSRHAFCWGENGDGELGVGDTNEYMTPQELLMPGPELAYEFDELSVGRYSACGRDGANVFCWGAGVLGTQQADGGVPSQLSPALVQF